MKHKHTYAEYRDEAKWGFVPAEMGRWIRTHVSAVFCGCADCGAGAGHPCSVTKAGIQVFKVPVCQARMDAYRTALRDGLQVGTDDTGKVQSAGKLRVRKGG